jgi:cytochrome oxidase Cu insertion factor (SCO1/SenC/PrrC family)
MDRHFVTIQTALERDRALKDVRLVTISFDPVTDTPAVLKRHAAALGANPARWRFLTGDRDDVDRFASRFGVMIVRDLDSPVDIRHNLRTAIIDADGQLVKSYTGNEWKPADVLRDVSALVDRSPR